MGNCWGTRVRAESPTHDNSPSESGISNGGSVIESKSGAVSSNGDTKHSPSSGSSRAFSFSDLKAATRNFRPDSMLGEGGFGCVFKGWIDEQSFKAARPGTGLVIAVKKLNLEGLQGHKEWRAEGYYLGQLHHPHLVKLIGFCAEDDHRLLVYEFMSRGSLENHLFRRGHNHALSWAVRIKIVVAAAKGLAFLHEAERPVIYRDFKTSNILLDSQYNAKLSDFGLAKDGPTGNDTHVSTQVIGTYGYAAPEYIATGHLTAKSDVYSFGVVLLEILTGRRAIDKNKPAGETNLVEWAKPYLGEKHKLFRLIDSRLEGQYSKKGAQQVASLALSCLKKEAKLRPLMKDVVKILEPVLETRAEKHSSNSSRSQENAANGLQALQNGAGKHLQRGSQQNGIGRAFHDGAVRP